MSTTPDYSLLTTESDCDEAEKAVVLELKTFTHRDDGFELADDRMSASQEARTAALAKKDKEIANAQNDAAQPGLSAQEQEDRDDIVTLLQSQRKKILRDGRASTGHARFKVSVDAVQAESQVALLTTIRDGIQNRRRELGG